MSTNTVNHSPVRQIVTIWTLIYLAQLAWYSAIQYAVGDLNQNLGSDLILGIGFMTIPFAVMFAGRYIKGSLYDKDIFSNKDFISTSLKLLVTLPLVLLSVIVLHAYGQQNLISSTSDKSAKIANCIQDEYNSSKKIWIDHDAPGYSKQTLIYMLDGYKSSLDLCTSDIEKISKYDDYFYPFQN